MEVSEVPTTPSTSTPVVVQAESVTPDPIGSKSWASEEIDQVTNQMGMRKLRDTNLRENDLEVRAWGGFGITTLQGFILRRIEGKWTSSEIHADFKKPDKFIYKQTPLPEPQKSWDAVWQALLEQGLLTLPDARVINCEAMYEDGYSYVIEAKKGKDYRTYTYDNPAEKFENRCPEADKILNIARIISDEYGASGF
jgi:hypothetical protein